MKTLKKVVIVGRVNVGKSTLFNRLTRGRTAIVAETEGVTRDRLETEVRWLGKAFILVDCGGLPHPVKDTREGVTRQVWKAVKEADLVLLVVDRQTGITSDDFEIVRALRKQRKRMILVVNKVDHSRYDGCGGEFARLGIQEIFEVSAISGRGTGKLLDHLVEVTGSLPEVGLAPTRIAVVGRRNVGKSTLINRLLGEERVIVADQPGTTRDAVEIPFRHKGREYILVDTAGLVLRRRRMDNLNFYSEVRALAAIDRADIVLFVLDVRDGILRTDKRIAGLIKDAGKASVIVSNKWDTAPLGHRAKYLKQEFRELIQQELHFMKYAPVIFVSALTGEGIPEIFKRLEDVQRWREEWMPPEELTQIVRGVGQSYANVIGESRITGGRQSGVDPTRIHILVRNAEKMSPAISQILEDEIRAFYPYTGVPIFFKYIEEVPSGSSERKKTTRTKVDRGSHK